MHRLWRSAIARPTSTTLTDKDHEHSGEFVISVINKDDEETARAEAQRDALMLAELDALFIDDGLLGQITSCLQDVPLDGTLQCASQLAIHPVVASRKDHMSLLQNPWDAYRFLTETRVTALLDPLRSQDEAPSQWTPDMTRTLQWLLEWSDLSEYSPQSFVGLYPPLLGRELTIASGAVETLTHNRFIATVLDTLPQITNPDVVTNVLRIGRDALRKGPSSSNPPSWGITPNKCMMVMCVLHRASDGIVSMCMDQFLCFQTEVLDAIRSSFMPGHPNFDISFDLKAMKNLKSRVPGCINLTLFRFVSTKDQTVLEADAVGEDEEPLPFAPGRRSDYIYFYSPFPYPTCARTSPIVGAPPVWKEFEATVPPSLDVYPTTYGTPIVRGMRLQSLDVQNGWRQYLGVGNKEDQSLSRSSDHYQ